MACGAASDGSDLSLRRRPRTRSAARLTVLLCDAGDCGFVDLALPVDALSAMLPELPGVPKLGGGVSEERGAPDVETSSIPVTDMGAKPR